MKKLLAVVLAACTAFALASCNNQSESDNKGNTDGSYTSGNTEYVIGCTGPLTGRRLQLRHLRPRGRYPCR